MIIIDFLNRSAFMQLDASTRRNLELTQPLQFNGSKKSTLLYLLDATKTSMGARLLRSWIDCPLQAKNDIVYRLQAVDTFVKSLPFEIQGIIADES